MGIAVDAVFDSVSVATTFREELSKLGLSSVLYLSYSNHPELVKNI